MTKQQFNELYEEVKALSNTGETSTGTDEVTSLYDWMSEGEIDDMTAQEIAAEWDELNEQE